MKVIIPRRLKEMPIDKLGSYPVQDVSYMDGIKLLLEDDQWVLLRFSGTEPLLRIFAEGTTPERAAEFVELASELVGVEELS
jgi:phosphomannomutase